MSVLYKTIKRSNPQNKDATPKYYAEAVKRGSISYEEFLDAVCEDTTLNRDEVRMAFNKGFKTIIQYSKMNMNVHLDSLGYTRTSVRSKGMDTAEEVTADTITDIVPHFVFSEKFRSELRNERLEKVKSSVLRHVLLKEIGAIDNDVGHRW
jgi:predicted histone-like DNA-binding protein